MTRQTTAVLTLALSLVLIRPALAQQGAKNPNKAQKCAGGAVKCGDRAEGAEAGVEYDLRVKFDEEDAKGEIMCKKGKLANGKVIYPKCVHDKLDKYEDVAIRKRIVSKEKFSRLDAKKKELVKSLAFYDSASKKLRDELKAMGENKDDIEYKKLKGAKAKVDKKFDDFLGACAKAGDADIACPAKD